MKPFLVMPSTTSHKHEDVLATLDVFSRLGMRDIDLNLHHLVEGLVALTDLRDALAAGRQHVRMVSGGWCDFYQLDPGIAETERSVDRQVDLAVRLDVSQIRLFFGRLKRADYTREARDIIVANIRRLAERTPHMLFAFENHDGASLCPDVCREILEDVNRPNVRMTFDPVNFEHAGVSCMDALQELRPFIAHVHLKGLGRDGDYCEFGAGALDLVPLLQSLLGHGYTGAFTVEYEGAFDRTVRLYQGLHRARAIVEGLVLTRIDNVPSRAK